jgi:WXG100 family type VII secretion target
MPYITVTREVKPDGADADAEQFRSLARDLREMAAEARADKADLDLNWSGRARDHFFEGFASVPDQLDDMAQRLEDMARSIQGKTVTIEEKVWVPVLEP